MKTIFVLFAMLLADAAVSQSRFEQGMDKAFELWREGKTAEAAAMFERIASAEKDEWLPNYYYALVNTTAVFSEKDRNKAANLLTSAQTALDKEMDKNPMHPELMILQALIHTGWIVQDPMTNGAKLSPLVMDLYNRALKAEPENPRAVCGKADFELGGARFFGSDIRPMCAEIERSIGLFEKEASLTTREKYYPKWGVDRARQLVEECASAKK